MISSTVSGTASNPLPCIDNEFQCWYATSDWRSFWVYISRRTVLHKSRTSQPQVSCLVQPGWTSQAGCILAATGQRAQASRLGTMNQTKEDVIRLLGLIPHADYGFSSETYRTGAAPMASRGQTDLSGDVYSAASIRGP